MFTDKNLFFTPLLYFYILFLVISKTIGMSTEVIKLMPKGTSFHPWKKCKNFCEVPICPGLYKLWSAMKMTCQCNHSCNHLLSSWANLEMSYLQSQTTLCPLQILWGSAFQLFPNIAGCTIPTYALIFMQDFHTSSWIWIMKT